MSSLGYYSSSKASKVGILGTVHLDAGYVKLGELVPEAMSFHESNLLCTINEIKLLLDTKNVLISGQSY